MKIRSFKNISFILMIFIISLSLIKIVNSACTSGAGSTDETVKYILKLYYPDGRVAYSWPDQTGTDITFEQNASVPLTCNYEGQYKVNWTPEKSEEGYCTAENVFNVNWDTQQYCKIDCLPDLPGDPYWDIAQSQCCGDSCAGPGP